jgi:hypothetical protein
VSPSPRGRRRQGGSPRGFRLMSEASGSKTLRRSPRFAGDGHKESEEVQSASPARQPLPKASPRTEKRRQRRQQRLELDNLAEQLRKTTAVNDNTAKKHNRASKVASGKRKRCSSVGGSKVASASETSGTRPTLWDKRQRSKQLRSKRQRILTSDTTKCKRISGKDAGNSDKNRESAVRTGSIIVGGGTDCIPPSLSAPPVFRSSSKIPHKPNGEELGEKGKNSQSMVQQTRDRRRPTLITSSDETVRAKSSEPSPFLSFRCQSPPSASPLTTDTETSPLSSPCPLSPPLSSSNVHLVERSRIRSPTTASTGWQSRRAGRRRPSVKVDTPISPGAEAEAMRSPSIFISSVNSNEQRQFFLDTNGLRTNARSTRRRRKNQPTFKDDAR